MRSVQSAHLVLSPHAIAMASVHNEKKSTTESPLEQSIKQLYDEGKYLQAYRYLDSQGGVDALQGTSGRTLAGRLVSCLGAPRYGSSILLRTWRASHDADVLAYYVGMLVARRRNPIEGLKFFSELANKVTTPQGISDVASGEAFLWASVRDYVNADRAIKRAEDATPERPWLDVVRGQVAAARDDVDSSVQHFQIALERRPYYRPALEALAGTLIQLDRVDQARTLIIDASQRIESGDILLQLAYLERELSNYEVAFNYLQQAKKLLVLIERDRESPRSLMAFEATLSYYLNHYDQAILLARGSKQKFHETVADNVEKNRETGRRVVLDVGFTLQHEVTCVPATLSTLSKYWHQPIEHLDIAEEICYDGTPAHAERKYLEDHGFFCREFTLTWESAQQLIDAGIPFTQTLVGYSMGHMQAVIGYDSRRGVLVYRDPNVRYSGEVLAEELIEKMRSTGPRGMVFVPEADQQKIECLELPEHQLWTHNYRVSLCLAQHDRKGAVAAYKKLHEMVPQHRLTIHARGRIAAYDGDLRLLLKLTDRLIEMFPDDLNQWSVKLRILHQIGTRKDRLKVLNVLCEKPDCEVVYRHELVKELIDDPRQRPRIDALLRRCLRSNPIDAMSFSFIGSLLWRDRNREESLQWYRAAATVESREESHVQTYFAASRAVNRIDEAMQMLRHRFDHLKTRDGSPGRSLADAYDQLMQTQEAADVLKEALAARPEDGDLKLFACQFLNRNGRLESAKQYLDDALGSCHVSDWNSVAAGLALADNDFEKAREHLSEALKKSPLNVNYHQQMIGVLADSRGFEAAVAHLQSYIEQFPKNCDLRSLLVETSSQLGAERAEHEARKHLDLHPHDAWCWRELGFQLVEQRKWNEALEAAKQVQKIEPDAKENLFLLGQIFAGVGKNKQARDYYLRALGISVDYLAPFARLIQLCESKQERREVLLKYIQEAKRQVILGETLLMLQEQAASTFTLDETLSTLVEVRRIRPDLWQSWSALVRQLILMKKKDKALETAEAAVKRFPLVPEVLLELADVQLSLDRPQEERKTLDRALAIDSRNAWMLRRSAEAYRRSGEHKLERQSLERACQSEPRNVSHQGALAEFLWNSGDRQRAIATIKSAIEKEPRYEWGWDRLLDWSSIVGEPHSVVEMASTITELRPKSSAMWAQKASILSQFPEHGEETLHSINTALKLEPRAAELHEQRAIILANEGRFEEALAACKPRSIGSPYPLSLSARAAVIERQRGKTVQAIELMKRVVDRDEHYAFGWSQLSLWYQENNNIDSALKCAKKLVKIAPEAAASWATAAHCYHASDDREQAKANYKRSIEVDPSYLYGGQRLLELQSEDRQFADALETLGVIGVNLSDYEFKAREALLACQSGKMQRSFDALRESIGSNGDTKELLQDAVDAILCAGYAKQAQELFTREIEANRAKPPAYGVLVEILLREARLSDVEGLCDSVSAQSPEWIETVSAYLEALGNAQATERFVSFLQPRLALLRRHNATWTAIGRALESGGSHFATIQWMQDWQSRTGSEADSFLPLAISALSVGKSETLLDISDHVFTLPVTFVTDMIHILAGSALVMQNEPLAALQRIATVRPQILSDFYLALLTMLDTGCRLCIEMEQGMPWKEAWQHWRTLREEQAEQITHPLQQVIVDYCEIMLLRRHINLPRAWFRVWSVKRLQSKLRKEAQKKSAAILPLIS